MFILPVVVVAVASIRSLAAYGGVMRCVWYKVSMVTMVVAMVPIVSVRVMPSHPCVMGVRGAAVLVVRRPAAAEALAHGEFGCQLSDGLSLVQYGLFLLDKALPEMEDGGFGLLTRPPPASRRYTLMPCSARPCCPCAWTRCREAGRVCIHGNGGANKAWVGSIVIVRP